MAPHLRRRVELPVTGSAEGRTALRALDGSAGKDALLAHGADDGRRCRASGRGGGRCCGRSDRRSDVAPLTGRLVDGLVAAVDLAEAEAAEGAVEGGGGGVADLAGGDGGGQRRPLVALHLLGRMQRLIAVGAEDGGGSVAVSAADDGRRCVAQRAHCSRRRKGGHRRWREDREEERGDAPTHSQSVHAHAGMRGPTEVEDGMDERGWVDSGHIE